MPTTLFRETSMFDTPGNCCEVNRYSSKHSLGLDRHNVRVWVRTELAHQEKTMAGTGPLCGVLADYMSSEEDEEDQDDAPDGPLIGPELPVDCVASGEDSPPRFVFGTSTHQRANPNRREGARTL